MNLLHAVSIERGASADNEPLVRESFNSLIRLVPILYAALIFSTFVLYLTLDIKPNAWLIASVLVLLSVMTFRAAHWINLRNRAPIADIEDIHRQLRRFALIGPSLPLCFMIVGYFVVRHEDALHQTLALMSIWVGACVSGFCLFYMLNVAALVVLAACLPLCFFFLLSGDRSMALATPFFIVTSGLTIFLLRENFHTFAKIIESRSSLETARRNLIKAMEMADAANRAKSRFLANMSHELRTPLNAIIGFAELIRGETVGPIGDKRYQAYGADIHEAARHLLDILSDILDMAKIESGQIDLDIEAIDITEIIRSALSLTRQVAEAKRITIEAAMDEQGLVLRSDARALKQIMINLLSNAVKFTAEGGSIRIEAALEPNGHAAVKVRDSGIGIAESEIERVFEPFEQASHGIARTYGGSGLGLAISRRLAGGIGAELSLESRLGAGTTAILRFPPPLVVSPGPSTGI